MNKYLTIVFIFCLLIFRQGYAADAGVEFGVADDLVVNGTGGDKNDADFKVQGFSAFGSGPAAQLVTSGAGSAFIQNNLEVGGLTYITGNLGIGTTVLTDKLQAAGGIKVGATYAASATNAPLSGAIIEGNVGIGTFAPKGTLDVGAGTLLVTPSGNVGVGTTQPVAKLHVEGQSVFLNGNVGIGTTKPLFLLHVQAPGSLIPALVASSTGNVGVGTTAGTSTLQIAGGLSIGTTSSASTFLLKAAPSGGLLVEGNTGLGTTSPAELLEVTGGNILQKSRNPRVVGSINDATNLNQPFSAYVSGKYAYVVAYSGDRLTITDISNPVAPSVLGSIYDTTNLFGPRSVYVSGKYAYVAVESDSRLTVVDISTPVSPIVVGSINDATNLNAPQSVYVSGKYAYVTAYSGDRLTIADISNSIAPSVVGSNFDSTNFNNPISVYICGKYAYVTAYDRLAIVDISNPVAPSVVGSIYDTTNLFGPTSVYVSGKYAYVAANTGNRLTIVDISNPVAPSVVGSIYDTTNLFGPRSVYVSGKYAYVAASAGNRLTVVDISNSVAPLVVGSINDDTNLSAPYSVYILGKYAYLAENGNNRLTVCDISGIDAPAANIGNIAANDITVSENIDIGNNAYVRSGLNVGPAGIHSDGAISSSATVSANYLAGNLGIGQGAGASAKLQIVGAGTSSELALLISDSSGQARLALQNDGRMGLGTTLPTEALDVNGRLHLAQGSAPSTTADKLYNVGGSLYWSGSNLSAGISKWTIGNGSDIYRFAGNVGIGTSTPLAALHVQGSGPGGFLLLVGDSSGQARLALSNDSGNLGIGLTNPSAPLEVSGTLHATSFEGDGSMITSISGAFLGLHANYIPKATNSTTIVDSLLIDDGANIGIGMSAPLARLDIIGSSSSAFLLMVTDSSGSARLALTNGGNLGIGTTAPLGILQSGASPTPGLLVSSAGFVSIGTTNAANNTLQVAGQVSIASTSPSSDYLVALTPDGGMLVEGNVGMGTTNPAEILEVTGGNILHSAKIPVEASHIVNGSGASQLSGATGVCVSGGYAYVASVNSNSLSIISVSNPLSPTETGTLVDNASRHIASAMSVKVSGKIAYVAGSGDSALSIIDVSIPNSPNEIGYIAKNAGSSRLGSARDVYVSGKYAYVCAHATADSALSVIDVSNPYSPYQAGVIAKNAGASYLTNADGVYVQGAYAYVAANGDNALDIIDISNPASPREVGWVVDGGGAQQLQAPENVVVSGKYAYLACFLDKSLSIIDVSNPASPYEIGSIYDDSRGGTATHLDYAWDVAVSGKYAYVTSYNENALSVFDISTPSSPKEVGVISGAPARLGGAQRVCLAGKYAYVAAYNDNALSIVDISGIDAPAANIGNIAANDITVSENIDVGNNAYVRSGLNVGSGGIQSDGPVSSSEVSIANYFAGNIGVGAGAVTPLARMAIWGSGTSADFALRIADSAGHDLLVVQDNGNVGVGQTIPSEALEVNGRLRLSQGSAPTSTTDKLYNVGGALFWNGTNVSTGAGYWGLTGVDLYRLTGNVGVGTSVVNSRLVAAGSVGVATSSPSSGVLGVVGIDGGVLIENQLGIGTTNPGPLALCVMSGNVGIGTTNASEKLVVSDAGKKGAQFRSGTDYVSMLVDGTEVARLRE